MAGRKRSTVPQGTAKTEVVNGAALPQQTGWPQFSWKDIPPFVAVIGGLAIALSVAWQLGFFWVLDLKLLSLLSTNDVLRNSLAAVPLALFGCAVGVALSWAQPPARRAGAFFLFEAKNPALILLWLTVFAVTISLLSGYWPALLSFVSLFIYGATVSWLRQKGKLGAMSSAVVYWFWVLALMFLLGASEAQLALLSAVPNYEPNLTTGETLRVNLLKVTSDTLMVMQTASEISVVPRAQVKLLKRLDVPAPHDVAWIEAVRNYLKDLWRELTGPPGQ
jgi:hypothetical protein